MFTCSTLLLFPYPVPADIHGSVQHVTLGGVPVDVLPRLFLWFSQVKHFECHYIRPPQEVQCVHMYSVAWDVLVICTNHYLTETGWELWGRGKGCVGNWGGSWGELCGKAVAGGELWGGCSSQALSVPFHAPPKRYSVCTCTVCLGRSLLYQSLFDSVLIMDFNNIATCLGVTFLYWGMCKVTPHFGCSSVDNSH